MWCCVSVTPPSSVAGQTVSAAPHPGGEGPGQGERHRQRPGGGAVVQDRPAHVSRRPPARFGDATVRRRRAAFVTRLCVFPPVVVSFYFERVADHVSAEAVAGVTETVQSTLYFGKRREVE